MARHKRNDQLSALLSEAGWSAAELARAVNALGAAQGLALRYDRTAVAHWLTGSRPRPVVATLAASALSRRCDRLVAVDDTGLIPGVPVSEGLGKTYGTGQGDAVTALVALCRAEADLIRRPFVTQSVYDLAAPTGQLSWTPTRPSPALLRDKGHQPTLADVSRLREMSILFTDLTERHGGAHARYALAAYLSDDVSRLLITPVRSPSLRRELFTGAAQLTHLLARMSIDAGHAGLAQRYYASALALAREAADPAVYAITLRAMSVQALSLGYHQRARQLAEAAVEAVGPRSDAATRSFLLSQRALTQACVRHRNAALADLRAAESEHGRASSPPGPFSAYPRAGLDYQRARTLLALGDTDSATQALISAVKARPDHQRRTSALTHARLAETLLRTGQLDTACVHWHTFLDYYPHLHSQPISQAFTRLLKVLRPHERQRHASGVIQRAHTMTHSPLISM
ncbi:hypothetical protein [Streptomyces beigongshangae]|uniref:hypothetical protein n=1 Tax=Streptomyces beigongshangae TaxID=2841597 RepID=UPI001C849088|nr:hypothetical protein [Streptomyces sp. REN17]